MNEQAANPTIQSKSLSQMQCTHWYSKHLVVGGGKDEIQAEHAEYAN